MQAKRQPIRRAFTIVELLVAMALIVLIMAVLSEAFVAGLESFRQLKALGDMQERLRVATTNLRRDLQMRHFEGDRKLSDDTLFWISPTLGGTGGQPTQGFFRIQVDPTNLPITEGLDGDNIPSFRLNPVGALPVLHFAIKTTPERTDAVRREHYLTARVPSPTALEQEGPPDFQQIGKGIMNSPWAEVAYFLFPTGEMAGSTPLYSLHRRQRVLAVPGALANTTQPVPASLLPQCGEVSCTVNPTTPGQLYFYNEYDVTVTQTRAMANANGISIPLPMGTRSGEPISLDGDDLLLTDVISFEIKVLLPGQIDFIDPIVFTDTMNLPTGGIYDTGSFLDATVNPPQLRPIVNPVQLRVLALKITLRVWDFKTQQTRQVTMIQDM